MYPTEVADSTNTKYEFLYLLFCQKFVILQVYSTLRKMDTYVDSYNGDDSIPVFLAFAIEEYKNYKGI